MPILPRTPSTPHPRTTDLEDLARTLSMLGSSRATIELVERWAEVGEPTPIARIAEARAFVDLRLVDRAWSRLRELVEAPEPLRDALVVAIELFLLREWHERARKLVAWATARDPSDPVLRALQARAVEPPTAVEPPNVDPDELTVSELVLLAEQHMAHGTFIKARSMLERARRRAPEHSRARDLLWALNGDFAVEAPLEVLYRRLSEQITMTPDETEQTEYLRKDPAADADGAATAELRFTSLFRSEAAGTSRHPALHGSFSPDLAPDADAPGQRTVETPRAAGSGLHALARAASAKAVSTSFGQPRVPTTGRAKRPEPRGGNTPRATPDRGDRTAVSGLAELEVSTRKSTAWGPTSSAAGSTDRRPDARERTDGGDDTQIARVVRRDGPGLRLDPPSLTGEEELDPLPGRGPPTGGLRRVGGEAEDDNVVVHTRRAVPQEARERRADPLRAVEAEANHERLASRWRDERSKSAVTEPRAPRPVVYASAAETTERLDWSADERAFFHEEPERPVVAQLFGRDIPMIVVAAAGVVAGALLVLGVALGVMVTMLD